MKCFVIWVLVVAAVARGDTVWTYPFSELGAAWEYGTWDSIATGAFTSSLHQGQYGGSYSVQYPLESGSMMLPGAYDSITVEVSSGYHHTGYTMDASAGITLRIDLEIDSGVAPLLDFSDNHSTWSHASFDVSDTTLVTVTLPLNECYPVELHFTAEKAGGGYMYRSSLDWCVWDIVITGHDSTVLSPVSWAVVKSFFQPWVIRFSRPDRLEGVP